MLICLVYHRRAHCAIGVPCRMSMFLVVPHTTVLFGCASAMHVKVRFVLHRLLPSHRPKRRCGLWQSKLRRHWSSHAIRPRASIGVSGDIGLSHDGGGLEARIGADFLGSSSGVANANTIGAIAGVVHLHGSLLSEQGSRFLLP